MLFNTDANQLAPEKDSGLPKKLIDLNVVKKGANFTSKKTKNAQRENDVFLEQEEERLRAEAKEKERLAKVKQTQAEQKEEGQIEKHKEAMKGGDKKKEV